MTLDRTLAAALGAAMITLPLTGLPALGTGGAPPRFPTDSTRTLMAVFAHPDDETIVAGSLVHHVREGGRVVLVTVTSGQRGGPNPGDSLGRVREGELAAAARVLGIPPAILLRFMDGTVATERQDEIAERIRTLIRSERPDVIVTFGPDGVTGHPDHIAVGMLTARVAGEEMARGSGPKRLYQVVMPRSRMTVIAPALAGRTLTPGELKEVTEKAVPDERIAVAVDIGRYLELKRKAVMAHRSQFSGATLARWESAFGTDSMEYFVQALPAGEGSVRRGSLFAGIRKR